MNENELKAFELSDEDMEKAVGGRGFGTCPYGCEQFNTEYCVNTIHCEWLDQATPSPDSYGCGWFGVG